MKSINKHCEFHSKTREDSSLSFICNCEEDMSAIIKTQRWPGEFTAKQLFTNQAEKRIPQGTTENTTGHQLPGSSILEVTKVATQYYLLCSCKVPAEITESLKH